MQTYHPHIRIHLLNPKRCTEVSSSVIDKVAYHRKTAELDIQFCNGHWHKYLSVTEKAYTKFIQSKSIGKHFNTKIRDQYPSLRLK